YFHQFLHWLHFAFLSQARPALSCTTGTPVRGTPLCRRRRLCTSPSLPPPRFHEHLAAGFALPLPRMTSLLLRFRRLLLLFRGPIQSENAVHPHACACLSLDGFWETPDQLALTFDTLLIALKHPVAPFSIMHKNLFLNYQVQAESPLDIFHLLVLMHRGHRFSVSGRSEWVFVELLLE